MKIGAYFILFLALLSCTEEKINFSNLCGSETISEGTPWYDAWLGSLDCTCEQSVFKGSYQNQFVFYALLTDPLCCGIFTTELLDCKGESIKTYGEDDWAVFIEEVISSEVIYRCEATRD